MRELTEAGDQIVMMTKAVDVTTTVAMEEVLPASTEIRITPIIITLDCSPWLLAQHQYGSQLCRSSDNMMFEMISAILTVR